MTAGSRSAVPVALVDARNVQRSTWPSVSDEEVVERARRWAHAARCEIVLVFDGEAPDVNAASGVEVVTSGSETADDLIAREAESLRLSSRPFWLVTSDRELRRRASPGAERTIGGGRFVRDLLAIPL